MRVFKHTKLLAAILLASQSYQAHSLVYTLDITTESSAFLSGTTDGDTDTGATSASSSANTNNSFGVESESENQNSSFAKAYTRAYGNADGSFYLTSGADGYGSVNETFKSRSTLTQSYEVTNDSALEQLFDFNFEVENGSISAYCGSFGEDSGSSNACLSNDYASASYESKIFLNNVSIWSSSASITRDVIGLDTDFGSDLLGGVLSGSYYSWDAQSFTLDLGTFAAGETFNFDYVVSVASAGVLDSDGTVRAYAQFGDPSGFGSTNNAPFGTSTVPEPASLALMMTGLLGFGVAAKRRKKAK